MGVPNLPSASCSPAASKRAKRLDWSSHGDAVNEQKYERIQQMHISDD